MVTAAFDSSALVRFYLRNEPDSQVVQAFVLDASNSVVASRIFPIEFVSALARQVREGVLSATDATRLQSDLRADRDLLYTLVDVTDAELGAAELVVQRQPVRALDALHIGMALTVEALLPERIQFWTADRRQATAARAEGLDVVLVGS
ncbi:MAG TPA: type II toxin-antitoxin system VapC family toxin [Tepidiformaceae bacterium]|nr:type II toxin-antitoxin system VapC family toxin [Tepidiformaceae bacterium]